MASCKSARPSPIFPNDGLRLVIDESETHPLPPSLEVGTHIEVAVRADDRAMECEVRRIGEGELGLRYFDGVSNARRKALIARIVPSPPADQPISSS